MWRSIEVVLLCCCCCCCWVASVVSDSVRPHRRQPTRLPIPGILQARTLEWVAISFSKAWEWKVKVKQPHDQQLTRLLHPWDFPGKSTGVGCHCLLCYVFIYKAILLLFVFYFILFCRYHTLKLCFFSQTEKSGFQLMCLAQHCPLKLSVMIEMLST